MVVRDLLKIETLEDLRKVILNEEENDVFSDAYLSEQLIRLGVEDGHGYFIPRLRGHVRWDYIGLID